MTKPKPIKHKADPYIVVIILVIIGWCIATMLTGGCSIDPIDEGSIPLEQRCSGVSILTCNAKVSGADASPE